MPDGTRCCYFASSPLALAIILYKPWGGHVFVYPKLYAGLTQADKSFTCSNLDRVKTVIPVGFEANNDLLDPSSPKSQALPSV